LITKQRGKSSQDLVKRHPQITQISQIMRAGEKGFSRSTDYSVLYTSSLNLRNLRNLWIFEQL